MYRVTTHRNIWLKSSYSSGNGQCVEATLQGGATQTRDSKDTHGATIAFSKATWTQFISRIRGSHLPGIY
ncbi:DUF397 domain-containing protein [Streptomyces sp. UNOC14_S4]|uniref:DUF397 domain-containing protein n=1 Tax=Streptomyces sp. UNOC14_S4 TaxID=2872340 RepID=UPI001E30CEA8|nr:DUF397 domain-containing protein [Streptomyces sp. UNOC14_S4]MCC3771957.1 DUF397 domain-containing protein [Streptomyces sp. UNOC14_S4]